MAGLRSFTARFGVTWRLGRFAKDTNAVTTVEFALILLPFLMLLGATVDAALLYFQTSQLQLVTDLAARKFLVNQILRSQTTPTMSLQTLAQFRDEYICTWQKYNGVVAPGTLSKMFDCSQVKLQIIALNGWRNSDFSISDNFQPPPQTDTFAIPTENQAVVFKIFYPAKSYFSFVGKFNGEANLLMGITAFRVEPAGSNQ